MVFFITGWSTQLRLIEHEAGNICEAIYQGEGAGSHWSPPAVIICALVPAASGAPEPQVASNMFAENVSKQAERPPVLPSPQQKGRMSAGDPCKPKMLNLFQCHASILL